MKNKFLSLLLLLVTLVSLVACELPQMGGNKKTETEGSDVTTGDVTTDVVTGGEQETGGDVVTDGTGEIEEIDYVANTKLDMTSGTLKEEVTVKLFIDGDTTHFNIDNPIFDGSVLKARYLAVNTPESTGKIEPYGKKAATFTKEKLLSATSIIIESDNSTWNADSTGGRYLVWVWYKTAESEDYRNLNLELLQNGLAIASNSGQNRYGETCLAAIAQAKTLKLNAQSGKPDPDHYYGSAVELTLRELRTNIADYNGMKVAFEGVITKDYSQTVYVEEYDSELDLYYGMTVYYGYGASAKLLENLAVGNRVRIVGTVSYYEAGGTYQVSGLDYKIMKPNHADNTQVISTGHQAAFKEVTAEDFNKKKLTVESEVEGEVVSKQFSLPQLIIHSTISMKNLQVISIYTTTNEESSSKGAMTLTCKVGNETIDVRTVVLYDADGQLVTASAYQGKNINVKGLVDYYDGSYQIKVFSVNDITFNE